MDRAVVIAVVGMIGLVFVMYVYEPADISDPLFCNSDSDCVPAQDCHPTSCIGLGSKTVSDGVFCTTECAPDTMDCGQGSCACVSNRCEVNWRE